MVRIAAPVIALTAAASILSLGGGSPTPADAQIPNGTPTLTAAAVASATPSATRTPAAIQISLVTSTPSEATVTANPSTTATPATVGPTLPGTGATSLRSLAATFNSATCLNLDNTVMGGSRNSDDTCHVTLPVNGVDGFGLPFVSNGSLVAYDLLSDGSGSIDVGPGPGVFFVFVTSASGSASTPSEHGAPTHRRFHARR